MDDDRVVKEIDAAARRIQDKLTELAGDSEQHGRECVFRVGMGDLFPAKPDPRVFLTYTAGPDVPTVDTIIEQLRAHPLWQAIIQRKPHDAVLAEQSASEEAAPTES